MKKIFLFCPLVFTISQLLGTNFSNRIQNTFNAIMSDTIKNIRPLKVGEKVPDAYLGQILNHPTLNEASISDFKGKLLILDFWATTCGVCIAQFPRLEKIQEKYENSITILPVGFDNMKVIGIKEFLEKQKGTKAQVNLPTALQTTKDSIIRKLFPFYSLPLEIWIDGDGILRGITDHHAISESNIERILSDKSFYFKANSIITNKLVLAPDEAFLITSPLSQNKNLAGSVFLNGAITEVHTATPFELVNNTSEVHLRALNKTIYYYYTQAYKDSIPGLSNAFSADLSYFKIESSVPFYKNHTDAKKMDNWSYEQYKKEDLFSYELRLPAGYTKQAVNQYMIEDFDRHFKIKSTVKIINTKCYSLIRTSIQNKFASKRSDTTFSVFKDSTDEHINFQNANFDEVLGTIRSSLADIKYPLLNNTDYKGKIQIELPIGQISMENMKKILNKYDLDIIETTKAIPMIVLVNMNQ